MNVLQFINELNNYVSDDIFNDLVWGQTLADDDIDQEKTEDGDGDIYLLSGLIIRCDESSRQWSLA